MPLVAHHASPPYQGITLAPTGPTQQETDRFRHSSHPSFLNFLESVGVFSKKIDASANSCHTAVAFPATGSSVISQGLPLLFGYLTVRDVVE
jgi:hypothetical protein